MPREPPAREVAGGVGERAREQHEVQRFVTIEDFVGQLTVQDRGGEQERQSKAGLDRERDAQRVFAVAARATLGDRAREQLFDRPVDDGYEHEHDRPQQRDPRGRRFFQHMAGDGEVGERQRASRGDPDREDARAAPIGAGARLRATCSWTTV